MNEVQNQWDERYSNEEYFYGKKPNEFLKDELKKLQAGKILFPAEGEGRNCVFAATKGWESVAFDSSIEGQKKAILLAKEMNVSIEYSLKSYSEFVAKENFFDVVALIFAHNSNRQNVHRKMISYLKKGGMIILEGFNKNQLNYGTGGPKSLDLLFSKDELEEDFKSLSSLIIEEKILSLDEGKHHFGQSSVIRLIGVK
ncbi:MAG: hypothetical protein AUJ98_06510 [Bacteroidetes bacterium CG2_30_33_31]|nr:MAG: hypothetical protein AUJ98_06510 [Bacteroidetes bacterium CG2_30_33_31]